MAKIVKLTKNTVDLKMEEMSDIQPGNDVFLFNIIEHNTFHVTVHDWVT
jgi:hypothetical protein